MKYSTAKKFSSRETKSAYVHDKYRPLLKGSVLDVGSDGQYLKPFIVQEGGTYYGVGFGDRVDLQVNLDAGPLPFDTRSFDTVLCLDVLEHLENIHFMFKELCRVASKHVIISLPNPYGGFLSRLRKGDYSSETHFKFYGLPPEPPKDRHRWFYSIKEAKQFVHHNASQAGWSIIQMDGGDESSVTKLHKMKKRFYGLVLRKLFHPDIQSLELFHGTLWCVLERKND